MHLELAILSVILVSLVSFVGVLTLSIDHKRLHRYTLYLVSLAAGALIGGAFLHLLPEAAEHAGFTVEVSLYILFGVVVFFIVEKIIHWRHCHSKHSNIQPFAWMNLFGDGVHNFLDGLVIATAYIVSIPLGITTTIAIILHEIPQEIGDFGVLIHGGFTRKRALLLNFASALVAIIGLFVGIAIGSIEGFHHLVLAFAAGGFVYIAASNLIPELHKETFLLKNSAIQLIVFLVGIYLMYLLVFLE